ncbi:transcriptional protein SWT1 isoform X1 [Coregonus clupeaformis]|uniref:transcriptional protein SWT1 isoform X1 n=1 Tax=Coregonus clupeaformis TaxID=59861 RepID=UPI001BDFD842|nr:transcriptional protein SWT1 isoform X1 [Coregonus clupeaformis]
MSKKSKKKKKQKKETDKLSSSSSEKSSQKQKGTKKRSSAEGKHHGSCSAEEKRGREKGVSHSTSGNSAAGSSDKKDREFKKALYRQGKTTSQGAAEGKNAGPLGTLSQDSSVRKSCPSQDGLATSEVRTADRMSSKPVSSQSANKTQSQNMEKIHTSQGSSSKPSQGSSSKPSQGSSSKPSQGSSSKPSQGRSSKPSQKSPSKTASSRLPTSPRSLMAQLKEQRKTLVKRRSRPEEKPGTGKDHIFQGRSSQEPQLSLSLAEEMREKRRKLVKRRSEEEREDVLKAKRDQSGAKPYSLPSNTTIKQSSTSTKNTTFEKISNTARHRPATQKQENVSDLSKTSKTSKSTCAKVEMPLPKPQLPLNFKIPKKAKLVPLPVNSAIWGGDQEDSNDNKTISARAKEGSPASRLSHHTGSASKLWTPRSVSKLWTPRSVSKLWTPRTVSKSLDSKDGVSAAVNRNKQHKCETVPESSKGSKELQPSSAQGMTSPPCNRTTSPEDYIEVYDNDQEMQLVEELHLARSEKRLELNVVEIYGELTSMDIDPSEEGATFTFSKEEDLQQDLIVVLDTNILLSHLDFVKKIRSHGLGALGLPTVLVPWVVLQELDSLKNRKRLSSSVAHLATPAVHYIYTCLKSQEPRLWGQSMQQASQSSQGLNVENNDDRVLQCCLQYQSLYREGALILCTNDKNLCSKALLSGVKALSKADLEEEVDRLKTPGVHNLTPAPTQPHTQTPISTQTLIQTRDHQEPSPSPGRQQNEQRRSDGGKERGMEEEKKKVAEEARELSSCVSVLEDCLKEALSQVLEVEMKAAYEELWTEIVYLKPPWTLEGLLQCFKKHWISVFGNIVPRNLQQSLENLHNFFFSGKSVERTSTMLALYEARELLQAFGCRSDYGGHVRPALSTLNSLLQRILPQPGKVSEETHTSDGDTLMAEEEEEEKQTTPPQVSHQEVWVMFENIWNNVCGISSAVFAALRFDPGAIETNKPVEGPPLPQDALSCLHRLSTAVRQLLQAFTRVLSTDSCLEDAQALLSFVHSSEIAALEPRFTANDLLDCLSQHEYREKLRVGGTQLAELNVSLERCAEVMSRQVTPSTWP